jgi:ribosome biogenesis GTPase
MKGRGQRNSPQRPKLGTSTPANWLEGLVISHLGQGLAVESPDGKIILCQTRRRLGDVAVGDRVHWSPSEDGEQGRVEEVLERSSVLIRPGYAGKMRVVASNLDRVFVVISPSPEPDWLLVDQYLAVCEFRAIPAEIIFNKIDLAEDEDKALAGLNDYVLIGYPTHPVSARNGRGLGQLKQALHEHCSMFAGQSGVGKSSLTNTLLPDKNLRIGEISERSGLGRHTTTTATLYHLPDGGKLVDSPGVAVFGLAEIKGQDLAWGYREFQPHIGHCRFNDCRHINDKGCAVREAIENGEIAVARHQRYLKLLEKLAQPETVWE